MKKLLFSFFFFAISFSAKSQIFLIDTFYLKSTQTMYGIYADINTDKDNYIYFDFEGPNDQQRVQAKISLGSDVDNFVVSLQKAKEIYKNWKKTASASKISLFSKKIPARFSDLLLYFTQDGKWYSQKGVDLKATFFANAKGEAFCVIETNQLTSIEVVGHSYTIGQAKDGFHSDNLIWDLGEPRMMEDKYCNGASLYFSSENEIDILCQKLKKAVEWKRNNKDLGKAFKN